MAVANSMANECHKTERGAEFRDDTTHMVGAYHTSFA